MPSTQTSLPSKAKYSKFLRYSHWIAVVLVVSAYITVLARKWFERGSFERTTTLQLHFLIGAIIFLITIPRIVQRLKTTAPPIVPPQGIWQDRLAKAAHIALYTFLIVMPILGVITRLTGGNGIGIPFTDLVIPSIMKDRALSHKFEDVHVFIADVFYYVIGFHALAAIYHWIVREDNVLQRML